MYWRDYDITYQADDVNWAALHLFGDNPRVNTVESVYIDASVYGTASMAPIISIPEKTILLYGDQVLTPYIVNPLIEIEVYGEDALQPAVITTPLLKLLVALALNPSAVESVYIESETATKSTVYPAISGALEISFYSEDTLIVIVDSFFILVESFIEDTVSPVLVDDAASIPLYDTVLKHLTDSAWETASIYVKQSDGTWQVKPLYMKQIDKQWM